MESPAARPDDPLGAFTDEHIVVVGGGAGPLAGPRFGLKDLYDVAGFVTRAGSPDWARTHGPAAETAPAARVLLDAGATLVGKTHTDELAYSLLGENAHYGTPTNPNAPGRVPGGSSSGSASAVAGHLVDFSVGSDTGGSVRVPASNCGIYGIRTTHGRISLANAVPLAPSFDTVGWFARDAGLLERVGRVYLAGEPARVPTRLLVARDAFAAADEAADAALAPVVEGIAARFSERDDVVVAPDGLAEWAAAWRILQAREIWRAHGRWIERTRPAFGPGLRERFEWASTVSEAEEAQAGPICEAARARLNELLPEDTVLCLPSAPSGAPRLASLPDQLEEYRTRTMQLTCSAGIAELPQISMPLAEVDSCPIGLSLLGPAGSDRALLRLVGDLVEGE